MHAEDIVQEAYLRTLKDLHKNPNKVIGQSYMYHTIKSISIDDGRKKTEPLLLYTFQVRMKVFLCRSYMQLI
tara:strand:- start:1 stop:216 length:216 start_codon:yes stop_codon:yes gene_type:complete